MPQKFRSQSDAAKWLGFRRGRSLLAAALFFSAGLLARATSVTPPEFSQLVNDSDFIVRAVVKSATSERARPGSKKIVTLVELDVREVIAGKPPTPLVLRTLGGKVGDDELVLEGAPKFNVGEESVFFVRGNGRQVVPLVAMMHGLYPVTRDESGRQFISRSNRVPLQNVAEVTAPMTEGAAADQQRRKKGSDQALSPDQFAQQIRAAVKPDNERLHAR